MNQEYNMKEGCIRTLYPQTKTLALFEECESSDSELRTIERWGMSSRVPKTIFLPSTFKYRSTTSFSFSIFPSPRATWKCVCMNSLDPWDQPSQFAQP